MPSFHSVCSVPTLQTLSARSVPAYQPLSVTNGQQSDMETVHQAQTSVYTRQHSHSSPALFKTNSSAWHQARHKSFPFQVLITGEFNTRQEANSNFRIPESKIQGHRHDTEDQGDSTDMQTFVCYTEPPETPFLNTRVRACPSSLSASPLPPALDRINPFSPFVP